MACTNGSAGLSLKSNPKKSFDYVSHKALKRCVQRHKKTKIW